MSVVVTPHVAELPMKSRGVLFRGLSDFEIDLYARTHVVVLRPREPTYYEHSLGAYFVQRQHLSTEHVLDMRRRFLSLSLSEKIAMWYATSGGYDDGIVAVYEAPDLRSEDTSGGGQNLWIGVPDDVPAFYDPRRAIYMDDIDAWQEGISRSSVDHEILLVEGDLRPCDLRLVRAAECPRDIKPWVLWGYSNWPSGTTRPARPPRRIAWR